MRLGDPGPREYPLEGVGRINALQLGICPNAQIIAVAAEDRFLVRVIAGHHEMKSVTAQLLPCCGGAISASFSRLPEMKSL
jgi:hypothetical protein